MFEVLHAFPPSSEPAALGVLFLLQDIITQASDESIQLLNVDTLLVSTKDFPDQILRCVIETSSGKDLLQLKASTQLRPPLPHLLCEHLRIDRVRSSLPFWSYQTTFLSMVSQVSDGIEFLQIHITGNILKHNLICQAQRPNQFSLVHTPSIVDHVLLINELFIIGKKLFHPTANLTPLLQTAMFVSQVNDV